MNEKWENVIIEDISIVVMVPPGTGKPEHIARPFHGLVFTDENMVIDYHFSDGKVLHVDENTLFYFPKGSSYRSKGIKRGYCYAINFDADISDEPFAITFRNIDRLLKIYKEAEASWKRQDKFSQMVVRKCLYEMILLAEKERQKKYVPQSKEKVIMPAIERIKSDFTNAGLSVSELSSLCNISEVYFRKIFNDKFGMSPKEYIISLRIRYAKKLLESGEILVSQVAQMCGYSDACLFSREFTKRIGCTPSDYKKASPPEK